MERRKVTRKTDEDMDLEDVLDAEEEEVTPKAAKKVAPAAPAKKVVVKAKQPVIEEEEDDEEYDEDDEEFDDEDEEEEDDAPVTKKTVAPAKKTVVPPPASKKVTPPPAPAKKAAAPVKQVKTPAAIEEEAEEETEAQAPKTFKVKTVAQQTVGDLLVAVMSELEVGKTVSLTRVSDDKWSLAPGKAVSAASGAGKLSGKAFQQEVCTPEYLTWEEEWGTLTAAEKMAKAKKIGVHYEGENDPKLDERVKMIRMTQAYREAMGIEKFKPEYRSQKARAALRG